MDDRPEPGVVLLGVALELVGAGAERRADLGGRPRGEPLEFVVDGAGPVVGQVDVGDLGVAVGDHQVDAPVGPGLPAPAALRHVHVDVADAGAGLAGRAAPAAAGEQRTAQAQRAHGAEQTGQFASLTLAVVTVALPWPGADAVTRTLSAAPASARATLYEARVAPGIALPSRSHW